MTQNVKEENDQIKRESSNMYDDNASFKVRSDSLKESNGQHEELLESSCGSEGNLDGIERNSTFDQYRKKPHELKKRYLFDAPIQFIVNLPPKIIDLTSDFFEKDQEKTQSKEF